LLVGLVFVWQGDGGCVVVSATEVAPVHACWSSSPLVGGSICLFQ
jgi:hypothetical protein